MKNRTALLVLVLSTVLGFASTGVFAQGQGGRSGASGAGRNSGGNARQFLDESATQRALPKQSTGEKADSSGTGETAEAS
jgi:hypothetical protein